MSRKASKKGGKGSLERDRAKARRLALLLAGVGLVACVLGMIYRAGRQREVPEAEFEGEQARALVGSLVELGPRHVGAEGRADVVAHLHGLLDQVADQIAVQRFEARDDESGETFELVNLVGRINPTAKRRILLASHWDGSPRADRDPDETRRGEPPPGANHGASGVAVLVELGRVLKARRIQGVGVDLVLFDGETFGPASGADRSQGSRHFGRRLRVLYGDQRPLFAVVIDLVGDCDQGLVAEGSSRRTAPEVVQRLWTTARQLGYGEHFRDEPDLEHSSDHTALLRAEVPSVLLIDYDYRFWHTHGDSMDAVCADSLERVGRVLTKVVLDEEEADG